MLILSLAVAAAGIAQPQTCESAVRRMIQGVSPQSVQGIVEYLCTFGTRHTLSDASSPTRGIGAARTWVRSQFESHAERSGGRMEVFDDEFVQPPTPRTPKEATIVNVCARLPGVMPEAAGRIYLVMGHLDSRNGDAMDASGDAPGANDDASGVAVALELARVLADARLDSTVIFVATSGEEQGLLGARHLAARAVEERWDIRAILNNDIVGDPHGPDGLPIRPDGRWVIRLFSEGIPRNPSAEQLARIRGLSSESDSPSRQVARYAAEVAERQRLDIWPLLRFRPDRFLRGGDHSAFNEQGFAAVRFTVPYEHFDRQHQNVTEQDGKPYGDVPEFVHAEYLAAVARLNAATIIHLANAPSSPPRARLITAALANDTLVRWSRSPEPDTAGYEVVWRDTTSPTWTHARDVGDATEFTSEFSKDDYFFGVRAYDAEGYRSPVAFCGEARE